MRNLFLNLFETIKRRKGYFLFLLLLSVLAVVLGIIGAINLSETSIDLSNISYIRFLKGGSYGSMIFSLLLSFICKVLFTLNHKGMENYSVVCKVLFTP